MKIYPLNYNDTNYKNVSFQRNVFLNAKVEDYEELDDITKSASNQYGVLTLDHSKIYNRPRTFFLREDIDWKDFIKYARERFQNDKKVNIYDYGCSNGMEAYTISMLIQHYMKNPDKFFPIYARDINNKIIKENLAKQRKNQVYTIDISDYYRTMDFLCMEIFEDVEKYLHFNMQNKKNGAKLYKAKINKNVTEPVKFSQKNILLDIENIDNKNPSIIFARNMWPYIDSEKYDDFAKKLYERLLPNSVVILGEYDVNDEGYIDEPIKYIQKSLTNAGFESKERMKTKNCCYFKKHHIVFEKN